jgi:hypothetical protein
VNIYKPTNAAGDSLQDIAVIELMGSTGVDTCQLDPDTCWNTARDKPINGRTSIIDKVLYGNQSLDAVSIYGWGKGQKLPAANDLGYTGVQRFGLLNVTSYSGSGTTTVNPGDGAAEVPMSLRRFNYNGIDGFFPCSSDSGSALMANVTGNLFVTFGINKIGTYNSTCQAGGAPSDSVGSAHALDDFFLGKFIFERERAKGFTSSADPSTGRFRCDVDGATDANGDFQQFMFCDNDGTVISQWAWFFSLY